MSATAEGAGARRGARRERGAAGAGGEGDTLAGEWGDLAGGSARTRRPEQGGGAESHAETAKLARLLGLDGPDTISYLYAVPATEIAAYREALTEALYDEGGEQLQRAADAARLLPARLLAKVGEVALGPLVCARLTGLIDPNRAAEISERFSLAFLAQLAAELDPRRAPEVVTLLPGDRVAAIAVAMAARGEQVAMGRFVAHLDAPTLAACVAQLSDEDVVSVAFVAEGSKPHGRIFQAAGVTRMRAALVAAENAGLSEEAAWFVEHLSASQRKKLGR
jgi:hypothetical protein